MTFIDTATFTPTTLTLPADADPRDVEIDATGQYAYVPSGDVAGNDALYVVDLATQTLAGTIDLGVALNANSVAIAEPFACSLVP